MRRTPGTRLLAYIQEVAALTGRAITRAEDPHIEVLFSLPLETPRTRPQAYIFRLGV